MAGKIGIKWLTNSSPCPKYLFIIAYPLFCLPLFGINFFSLAIFFLSICFRKWKIHERQCFITRSLFLVVATTSFCSRPIVFIRADSWRRFAQKKHIWLLRWLAAFTKPPANFQNGRTEVNERAMTVFVYTKKKKSNKNSNIPFLTNNWNRRSSRIQPWIFRTHILQPNFSSWASRPLMDIRQKISFRHFSSEV